MLRLIAVVILAVSFLSACGQEPACYGCSCDGKVDAPDGGCWSPGEPCDTNGIVQTDGGCAQTGP